MTLIVGLIGLVTFLVGAWMGYRHGLHIGRSEPCGCEDDCGPIWLSDEQCRELAIQWARKVDADLMAIKPKEPK